MKEQNCAAKLDITKSFELNNDKAFAKLFLLSEAPGKMTF